MYSVRKPSIWCYRFTNLPNVRRERDREGWGEAVRIDKSNSWTRRKLSLERNLRVVVLRDPLANDEVKMWLRLSMRVSVESYIIVSLSIILYAVE